MNEADNDDSDWSIGRWTLSPTPDVAVGRDLERTLSVEEYRAFRDAAGLLRQLAGGRMTELEPRRAHPIPRPSGGARRPIHAG